MYKVLLLAQRNYEREGNLYIRKKNLERRDRRSKENTLIKGSIRNDGRNGENFWRRHQQGWK